MIEFIESSTRVNLIQLSSTDSTQDEARSRFLAGEFAGKTGQVSENFASGGQVEHPIIGVIVTDAQTAGRGRLGRTWESGESDSLLASIIVAIPNTEANLENLGWLTLMAALATRDSLEIAGSEQPVEVKWPNDVVINREACRDEHRHLKVAGILGELLDVTPEKITVALGIGANVHQGLFELPPMATSLRLNAPELPETARDQILARLLDSLSSRLTNWLIGDKNRNEALRAELSAVSSDLGHALSLTLADGTEISGFARQILADGSLQIDTMDGPYAISPADVAMLAAKEIE